MGGGSPAGSNIFLSIGEPRKIEPRGETIGIKKYQSLILPFDIVGVP